jgi:hypothetical protein
VLLSVWVIRAGWIFVLGSRTARTCFPGHYWDWWFWQRVIVSMLVPGIMPPGSN